MGGERFDQAIPESYLFGENADLNWLGNRPIAVSNVYLFTSLGAISRFPVRSTFFQFPYLPPKNSEPTKTLKSLVNIRKESVKFVKAEGEEKGYNIEVSEIECNFDPRLICSVFSLFSTLI
jgi:hypothetical protein